MLRMGFFVLVALMLLPVAEAAAQKKEKKAPVSDRCREQVIASCRGYGTSRDTCVRAGLKQCKS
jgi:hypothetical protein